VFSLSENAFVISIIMIVVSGQRASLRKSIGLNDDFFEKEKRTWENQLDGFPNLDRILENLDEGRLIASLFDKGFFNLVVLWSCNVMEEVVDATAKGVISKCPEKRQLFKTETGHGLPYPTQLKNLGYRSYQSNEEFNIDRLWNRLRNKIAHHNYRPSFDETNKALQVIVSFVKEMPTILQDWKSEF